MFTRRFILTVILLCFGIILGGGVLLAALRTSSGLDVLRWTVERSGSLALNGQLSIGRIEGNLWRRLIVRDLSMSLPDSLGGHEVIGAQEIRVSVNLWSAFTGRPVLSTVYIDGLRVTYREAVGPNEWDSIGVLLGRDADAPSTTPDSPTALYLPELQVVRGHFLYIDPRDSTRLQARNIFLRGRLFDTGRLSARIETHAVAFSILGYQDSLSTMLANISLDGDSLTISELTMEATASPALAFHMTGAISSIKRWAATLSITAHGNAGSIGRIIGTDGTLDGPFQLFGSLTNTLTDPVIKVHLESSALRTDLGRITQASLDLRYTQKVLTIDRYRGRAKAGWVSGHGELDGSRLRNSYRLRLAPSTLVLDDLPSTLVGSTFPFAGKVTLDADLVGVGFDDPVLHGTAKVTSPSLRVAGMRLDAFSAATQYDKGRLTLDVRASGAQATAAGTLLLNGKTDLAATISMPDVGSFLSRFGDAVSGVAEMTATVRGDLTRPVIHLIGKVDSLAYADVSLGTLQMKGSLDTYQIARVEASLDSTKVNLAVEADLTGRRTLNGALAINDVSLRDYHIFGEELELDGIIAVKGSLEGSLQRPLFRGDGLLRDLSIRGENLGNTSLSLTLEDRDLSFTLVTPDFSVVSDGFISLTDGYPFDVRLNIKRGNLSPLLTILAKRKIEQHTGRFSGQLKAVGFAEYPDLSTITAALDSLIITMEGRDLYFSAPSTIRLDKQLLTIDRLELTGDLGHILVNGIASLKPAGLIDVQALFEGVQLDFLSPFLLSQGILDGSADGYLSLTGSPESPLMNGLFSTSDIQYIFNRKVNQLGTIFLSMDYEDRMFRIPSLSLDTPLGSSNATVSYPIDLSWGGGGLTPVEDVFTASLMMNRLAMGPLLQFIPSIPTDLDGRINGRIDLTGPTAKPGEVTGTVRLDSLRLFGLHHELVNDDVLHMRFNAGSVDVDTITVTLRQLNRLSKEFGRLTTGGRLALSTGNGRSEESDLTITGQAITMEAMFGLLGLDLPVTGTLNGNIRVTGPASFRSLDGRIGLGRPTYNDAVVDSIAGRFVYEYGDLVIHDFQMWVDDRTLTAYGTVPFDPDRTMSGLAGNMAITVESRGLDLKFLSGINYDIERIEGKADIQLIVGGTPFAPRSVGEILIRGAQVRLRDINPSFKASQVRLLVDGNQFSLQPVEMKAGKGSLFLFSRFDFKDFALRGYEAHATMSDAEIELVGTTKLNVNGSLSLTGDDQRGQFSSTSLGVTGTVTYPLNLGVLILGTGDIIRPQTAPDPFLEGIALDIECDVPLLRIRNNMADIDIEGGLAFSGTAQNPIVTGNATARDNGVIVYLDTKFDVLTGRLEFLKRTPLESFTALLDDPVLQLDPQVTIQAETEGVQDIYGEEYDVTMLLTGRAMQPNLQLTAIPAGETQANVRDRPTLTGPPVVSLLTFGLSGMEGSAQEAFTGVGNRALMMATGNQAEKLLKLDEVRIEGDVLNNSDTSSPAQITISKRINRRTKVTFTRLFDSSEYKLRVGYQLFSFLFIETFTDHISEQQQDGVDLKVKFRFR